MRVFLFELYSALVLKTEPAHLRKTAFPSELIAILYFSGTSSQDLGKEEQQKAHTNATANSSRILSSV